MLTLCTLALSLTVSGVLPGEEAVRRPPPPYVKDLTAFFEEIDRHYPFFAVKKIGKEWKATKKALLARARRCRTDVEFIEIVDAAARGLRDGHFSWLEVRPEMPGKRYWWPGIALLPATKGRVVVMNTAGNLKSALPPGTIVLRINGKPARRYLEARSLQVWKQGGYFSSPQRARFFEYRQAFSGLEKGETFKLQVLVGRKKKTLNIVRNLELKGWDHNYHAPEGLTSGAKSVFHAKLESGFGYVYLRRMDDSVESGLRATLAAHPDVKGWIFDLRGNTGGGYDRSLRDLTGKFQAPVAVIIDAGAVSAAETYCRDIVNIHGARVFGAVSAGSSSTKNVFTFPSGIAKVRYSTGTRPGLGGKPIEFNGITPHEEMEADPAEVARGLNSEIVRAEVWLARGGKK